MSNYRRLENTILTGDMNTVQEAVDCEIIGNMNTVRNGLRCVVRGSMNTVTGRECTVTGDMSTLRER